MQSYLLVRQAYFHDGKSHRQISREFGLNRRSVRKMLEHSSPPGYIRKEEIHRPKLEEHVSWIESVVEGDKQVHPKQRHTAKRLYDRLKSERCFMGCYSTVRSYVAQLRLKSQEMYVPLTHDAGMAQCDFGEARATIGGKSCKVHYLVMQLPYSDAVFAKAYPTENTESFCDGHVSAFEFFGGVPLRILYDNTKIAVAKIVENGVRKQTKGFLALKSHYLFKEGFANIASGWEKGGVENLVGYVRRNFMVPVPVFDSFAAFNIHLAEGCKQRQSEIKRGHQVSVGARLKEEVFLPLPAVAYECCRVQSGRINSQGLVRFDNNDYSVPTSIGKQQVLVKGYVDSVRILYEHRCIAEHPRSYGSEEALFNPLHYLKLLERKTGAFEQASPLKGWVLPSIFQKVHDILFERDGKEGRRSYIRILRLLESYSVEALQAALEQAVGQRIVDESAIHHLIKRHVEGRPPNLSLDDYPTIPTVAILEPDLSVYTYLYTGGI